ncbi:MAG: type II toxin-antitoxin system PemK/MazF family toxin [Chromatiales bacterium]|nr:type II toxin-antitoxin system PemK/MazF family toxin [Chromatiales bacterium]
MTFEAYDVVVVPFPFVDKAAGKRRPALVLSGNGFNGAHDQFLLAMITTAKISHWPSDVDLRDWSTAGLTQACKVRFKVFTLEAARVVRRIGRLSDADRQAVARSLRAALEL